MKISIFFVVFVLLQLQTCYGELKISDAEYKSAFANYKKTNKITYPDEHAELVAFTFFKDNYQKVKEINLNFTTGDGTFKTSLNAHADVGDDFFAGTLNNLIEEDDSFQSRSDLPEFPKTNLTYLNYADSNWNCTAAIVNQGNCGSCYAFAAAAAIEGVCCKKNGNIVKLSEQQLVDCTFNDEYGNIGCKGGKISMTLTHALDGGVEASSTYPYSSLDNGTCLYDGKDIVQRIKNFMRLPSSITEDYLMDALAALGPLIVGINGSSRGFQFYKSGVFFDEKCKKFVNHAVILVGFGTDPEFGDYWIMRNSYGPKWGEGGYFRITRGQGNVCGILSQVFLVYC